MSKFQLFTPIVIIILLLVFYHSLDSSTKNISVTVKPKPSTIIYKEVLINNRQPFYKLATHDGQKPYADGDRAQGTVVKYLQLMNRCQNDPSLIVIDIGAYLGDFGLYAAACGCQVYMFEVQPGMVDLIRRSISINNFSSSRVQIINKAVSNLPTDSSLRFAVAGGSTTATNGTLTAKTIRLDDIQWILNSKIFLLKIDVEGFELDVLRSAEKLFRDQRIEHMIFEYTAFWTERASQKDLLSFVRKTLNAKKLYALHRTGTDVYGPLNEEIFDQFYRNHIDRHLQTDIYATFVDTDSSIEAKQYDLQSSFA